MVYLPIKVPLFSVFTYLLSLGSLRFFFLSFSLSVSPLGLPSVSPPRCDSVAFSLVLLLRVSAVAQWVCLGKSGEGGKLELRMETAADLSRTCFPTVEYPMTRGVPTSASWEPRSAGRIQATLHSMLCAGSVGGGRGLLPGETALEGQRGHPAAVESMGEVAGAPDFPRN